MDRLPVAVRRQAGPEHCPETAGQGSPLNFPQATLPQHWQCWRPSRRHEVEALRQAAFQPVMSVHCWASRARDAFATLQPQDFVSGHEACRMQRVQDPGRKHQKRIREVTIVADGTRMCGCTHVKVCEGQDLPFFSSANS